VESCPSASRRRENLAIQTWPDIHGDVFAHCYTQEDTDWIELPGLATFVLSRGQHEVTVYFHPRLPDDLIHETYLRAVLPLVLQANGTEVLHSSAVSMPQGTLALCGQSWSGKSTMAYALSRRGYRLRADDAVPFYTAGEEVLTPRLPFQIQLRPASRSFFGLDRFIGDRAQGGHFHDDRQVKESATLAAVGILRPIGADRRMPVDIHRLSLSEAFQGVLSHAYCFSLHDRKRKRRMMERYLELCTQIPVFEIRYTRNLEHLGEVATGIEAAVNALCPQMAVLVKQP
jgi:hypothetical protein